MGDISSYRYEKLYEKYKSDPTIVHLDNMIMEQFYISKDLKSPESEKAVATYIFMKTTWADKYYPELNPFYKPKP